VRELPVTEGGKPDRSPERLRGIELAVMHYTRPDEER
jgi:hypothetical protein